MVTVEYSTDTVGVDWDALKAVLVADNFDNGRTSQEYRRSHERSHAVVFGRRQGRYVANGRILSDGVCNAYLVDIWTASDLRRQGIGREVIRRLLETVPGQHVGLFTEHAEGFYTSLGFGAEPGGMSRIVGSWLGR
jgi:GNAT superfamily N-acetyltransferase